MIEINNLIWQDDVSNGSFTYGELSSFLDKNPGWRLPTVKELLDLANYDLYHERIIEYHHWLWSSEVFHGKGIKTGYAVLTKPDGLVHEVTACFGQSYARLVCEKVVDSDQNIR